MTRQRYHYAAFVEIEGEEWESIVEQDDVVFITTIKASF